MPLPYELRRAALAEAAARRAAAGLGAGPVLPRLRLLTTAELLRPLPPPGRAVDLGSLLDALCEAVRGCVRRRPGWLYAALPAPGELPPVQARPALAQAAVLSALRGVLAGGTGPAVLRCTGGAGGVLLCLHGGRAGIMPPDAFALWQRLAGAGGGAAAALAGPQGGFILRLPAAPALPLADIPTPGEMVGDRYGLVFQYLAGFAAGEGAE